VARGAQDPGGVARGPDDDEVVPHHRPADRLVGEPVGDELLLERWRVADEDVTLPGAGVGDRLARADGDELQVPLREALLELRRDELVEHARVPHTGRALHDQVLPLSARRRRAEADQAGHHRGDAGDAPRPPLRHHALASARCTEL
jgi:hypothetical protein